MTPALPRPALARRHRVRVKVAVFLALLAFFAYGPSLFAPFQWDDFDTILPTKSLKDLRNVPDFFRPGYWVSTESPRLRPYRPLRETYFAVLYAVCGIRPAGWHAANLLFHAANTVLLYIFLTAALDGERPALFAAVLFAVHGSHAEAVAWAKNAGELLAFGFSMASGVLFLSFLAAPSGPPAGARLPTAPMGQAGRARALRYAGSLFAFLLAVGAKESAAVLPVVLALVVVLRRPGPAPLPAGRHGLRTRPACLLRGRQALLALAPFFLAVLVYAAVQLGLLGRHKVNFAVASSQKRGLAVALGHAVETVWQYGMFLALPVRSHAWWSPLPGAARMPWTRVGLLAAGGVALLAGAAWLCARSRRFALGFGWTLLGLAPAANLLAYNSSRPIAEQRTYFPSAGWCIVLAAGLQALRPRRAGGLLLAALAVVFTACSVDATSAWCDARRLWVRSVRFAPDVAGAQCNLGNTYHSMKLPSLAAAAQGAAARHEPDNPQILNNLGVGMERNGDLAGAMKFYRKALASMPPYTKARHNLALALLHLNRLDEARQELDSILRRRPDYVPALLVRADIYGRQGRIEGAIGDLRAVLKVEPDHPDAVYGLGRAYHILSRFDEALDCYRRVIALRPGAALAWAGIGRILAVQRRTPEAVQALSRAAELDPSLVEAHHALAGLFAAMGKHAEAADRYARCLQLAEEQDLPPAERASLLRVAARQMDAAGRTAEARRAWSRLLQIAPGDAEAARALGMKGPQP